MSAAQVILLGLGDGDDDVIQVKLTIIIISTNLKIQALIAINIAV